MKSLTVTLSRQNKDLSEEYHTLMAIKKQSHLQNQKKKKRWGNWLTAGKQKISSLLNFTKQQASVVPVQNEIEQHKADVLAFNKISPQSKKHQREDITAVERKKITPNNFNFDDIYEVGKNKIVELIDQSGKKIKLIKEKIVDKFQGKVQERDYQYENQREQNQHIDHQQLVVMEREVIIQQQLNDHNMQLPAGQYNQQDVKLDKTEEQHQTQLQVKQTTQIQTQNYKLQKNSNQGQKSQIKAIQQQSIHQDHQNTNTKQTASSLSKKQTIQNTEISKNV